MYYLESSLFEGLGSSTVKSMTAPVADMFEGQGSSLDRSMTARGTPWQYMQVAGRPKLEHSTTHLQTQSLQQAGMHNAVPAMHGPRAANIVQQAQRCLFMLGCLSDLQARLMLSPSLIPFSFFLSLVYNRGWMCCLGERGGGKKGGGRGRVGGREGERGGLRLIVSAVRVWTHKKKDDTALCILSLCLCPLPLTHSLPPSPFLSPASPSPLTIFPDIGKRLSGRESLGKK